MRLAILGSRGIPARYGGFETFAEQLAVRLVERGYEVTVFCEAVGGVREEYKGVRLRHIRARNLGSMSTLVYDAQCLWEARSNFDVIYMLGYGSSALCWVPRMWGKQVWINMDGLEWARGKWNGLARRYFRWAEAMAMWTPNRIIADAAGIHTSLQRRYRKMPPCDIVPYGCEIVSGACAGELKSFGLAPASYYLAVCRFEPENHVKEIIEGFLRSKSDARLVLVGDHTRKNEYAAKLAGYKSERLLFTGAVYDVPRVQALRYFCRAYLHGHSVGGTNPSLLEAMGCGNAVIAHDNEFNREVLGGAAIFFKDCETLCTAIGSVDSGKVDAAWMKRTVIERVKRYYRWDRITDHYCELLSLVRSHTREQGEVIQRGPIVAKESGEL